MNRQTGKPLAGIEHLRQRIGDVLTTPVGSRVMRREYGSSIFELQDAPINDVFKLKMTMAVYQAWLNPINGLFDFVLQSVTLSSEEEAHAAVDIVGKYAPTGEIIKLEQIGVY
ncbi:hypothetical protein P8629_01380 [Hydrogenovibrio sp. 3SP14C1]|uniref:hypothetical protein n=1 Tax=Hydrogenovibrio sp. 3SP14C1 TaxID=3038774 RepID=UPI0024159D97|nr:hypothetical protein [Hydrogenovibrio sp. 3SP14C1]MDG4811647.1 hypothetical protein [Hydrogenovibrio sp. 3SP14C1]